MGMTTIFDLDIPFRDHLCKQLGDGVRLFPGGAVENLRLPYVWLSRKSASPVPSRGAGLLYHCTLAAYCYAADYRAGVVIAGQVAAALAGARLLYRADDGGRLAVNSVKTGCGAELYDGEVFCQEVAVECSATVLAGEKAEET